MGWRAATEEVQLKSTCHKSLKVHREANPSAATSWQSSAEQSLCSWVSLGGEGWWLPAVQCSGQTGAGTGVCLSRSCWQHLRAYGIGTVPAKETIPTFLDSWVWCPSEVLVCSKIHPNAGLIHFSWKGLDRISHSRLLVHELGSQSCWFLYTEFLCIPSKG